MSTSPAVQQTVRPSSTAWIVVMEAPTSTSIRKVCGFPSRCQAKAVVQRNLSGIITIPKVNPLSFAVVGSRICAGDKPQFSRSCVLLTLAR